MSLDLDAVNARVDRYDIMTDADEIFDEPKYYRAYAARAHNLARDVPDLLAEVERLRLSRAAAKVQLKERHDDYSKTLKEVTDQLAEADAERKRLGILVEILSADQPDGEEYYAAEQELMVAWPDLAKDRVYVEQLVQVVLNKAWSVNHRRRTRHLNPDTCAACTGSLDAHSPDCVATRLKAEVDAMPVPTAEESDAALADIERRVAADKRVFDAVEAAVGEIRWLSHITPIARELVQAWEARRTLPDVPAVDLEPDLQRLEGIVDVLKQMDPSELRRVLNYLNDRFAAVDALNSQPASTNPQTWEDVYCPNCPGVAKIIAGLTYRCPHCDELSEADVPVDALGPASGTETERCGICIGAIIWDPNEPTRQQPHWRHVNPATSYRVGAHRAIPATGTEEVDRG